MVISTRVAGVWTPVHTVWTRVAGTWVKVQQVHTRVASVWTKVHGGSVVVTDPTDATFAEPGGLCHAGFVFQTDGGLDIQGPSTATNPSASGEWWSEEPFSGIGSDYRVRCVSINSGAWTLQAAAVGTWVRMDVARTWRCTVVAMAAPDLETVSANMEIAPYPSGAAVATFVLTASASN